MRRRVLFMRCREHIMRRRMYTVFYVRCYYSSLFQKRSYAEHMQRYAGLTKRRKDEAGISETADVRTILHHILDALFSIAMKQINEPQESDEAAAEKNFGLIFSAVKNYINQDLLN